MGNLIVVIPVLLVAVYAAVRLAFRLRKGDVESAGSFGDTFTREPKQDIDP